MNLRLGLLLLIECCMWSSLAVFVNVHGHDGVLSQSSPRPPPNPSIQFLFHLAMVAVSPSLFM